MFLSVILPIYNVERYLVQCIESVLKQNFKNYEMILIDDGSEDSSAQICDNYANKYNNIKVVHKVNGGLSSARNTGLKFATGQYVYFLDSDDYLLNDDFLSKIFAASKNNPDLILFKHIRFFENQNKYSDCLYNYKTTETEYSKIVSDLVKKDSFFGMAWIKVIKKEVLTNNKIEFIEGLLGEDMPWNIDLYLNSKSLFLIDSIEYVYRQRINSITTTTKLRNLVDFINILEQKFSVVLSANCNETLKEALFGALAKYYSNMLITYVRVNDKNKKQYIKKIKSLSVLLDYSLSQRPIRVKKIMKIFGLEITLILIKILDRIRK